jgi:RND family efflux transporter MFP subunit
VIRRWVKWGIAALVLAALVFGTMRIVSQRQALQAANAAKLAERAQAGIELAPTDLVQVQVRTLPQEVTVSGSLKAANVVVIKARVAGELQGLSLREGDAVRAGQVVAQVEPADAQARLRQSQQQAEAAKAQVDIARRTYENNRSLVEQGFISKFALESASASLASAEASYRAALAGADLTRKALEDTVLRSPISGLVSQRLAHNGERMALDGRVLEVVDLRRMEVEASLSAAEAVQVQPGQKAQLRVEGVSTPLSGTVSRVNPNVLAGSRAVLAYLVLDPVPGLRQGLFVQGRIQIATVQAPSVPLSAVRSDKPTPYVQLVENNMLVHQPVQLGARAEVDGQTVVVLQGVPANARLVSGAVGTLREGLRVTLTPGAP